MWRRRIKALLAVIVLCLCVSYPSSGHETLTTTVLFDREIVRILDKHCVMCHTENGPSFPLETYEQTWLQGRKIRAEIMARHMPPWPAVPGYGEFANENRLTLREVQFLISWVEGLGPRNAGTVFTNVVDTSGRPREAARAKADFGRWQLGKPSLELRVEGGVIDTGLRAPRRLRAIEYLPADRRSISVAFFSIQETGEWIGAWTPWYGFMEMPAGAAFQIPAGAHIVAEIHYRRTVERPVAGGVLGLFFDDGASSRRVSALTIPSKAGANAERYRGESVITGDTRAVALRLDAGEGVKSVEVSARKPDGSTDVLLFAKDFSADWPTPFIFKQPVLLRRGTVLSVTTYGAPAKTTVIRY